MEVLKTNLPDVWLIKPDIFEDFRGDYVMTFNKRLYQAVVPVEFVEEDISTSARGVLRGIHYSPHCWKLNQCLYGAIYYVVVNCDESDPDFGQWQSFILSDRNRHQLLKHPRYGSGLLALTDFVIFHYMQSQYYNPANPDQQTFRFDDERFHIWWPKLTPIVSQRDEVGHY